MLRRDALKVMGTTAVAVATLDGEVLAKPLPIKTRTPQHVWPYQMDLGWYGVIRCDHPFTLTREKEIDTGFQFRVYDGIVGKHHPIFSQFISDKFLTKMQKAGSLSLWGDRDNLNYKYDLMPSPKMAQIVYFNRGLYEDGRMKLPQPVLVQTWDEEITARFPDHEPNYLMVGKKGKYFHHFGWTNTSGQGHLEETLNFCFDSHGIKMLKYNKNPIKRTRRFYHEGKLAISLHVAIDDWWVAREEWIAAHAFTNGQFLAGEDRMAFAHQVFDPTTFHKW